ncbi:MAG: hypothetical protein P4L16_04380 [Chlamydiales bacterium]|nr:hypothetical protein [Chlamydiales bacterium]
MSMYVKEILLGRPLFEHSQNETITESFFKNNKAITHLKPSSHDPYSFWGRIQNILLYLLSFIVNLSRPSALSAQERVLSSKAQNHEIVDLYKRCLSENGKKTSYLTQYEDLIKQVKDLQLFLDEDRALTEKIAFRNNFIKKITSLKAGENLLIPLTTKEDVSVVYFLQKNQNSYSLKIIGCDEWISQISGIPSKKVGGKEKVLSQIAFENIPENYFTQERILTLFCEPLLEDYFSVSMLQEQLGNIPSTCRKDVSQNPELWVTKKSSHRKSFGLLIQELNTEKNSSSHQVRTSRKRLEFQLRLFALFDFFKEARFFLKDENPYTTTLNHLTKEIAKEASLLYTKGFLTREDMEEIQKELLFIEKTTNIANAQKKVDILIDKTATMPLNLQLPQNTIIKSPVTGLTPTATQTIATLSEKPLQNTLLIPNLSLFSSEEKGAMKSNDPTFIVKALTEKTELAEAFAGQGKNSLAVELILELTQHLKLYAPEIGKEINDCWPHKVSEEQALQVQRCILKLTKVLIQSKEKALPPTNQVVLLFQLARLAKWLDASSRHGSHLYNDLENSMQNFFNLDLYHSERGVHAILRPFYLIDEENAYALNLMHRQTKLDDPSVICSNEGKEKSKEHCKELNLLIKTFFNLLPNENFESLSKFKFFLRNNVQAWSKPIQNPLLFAALQRMHLTSHVPNVIDKLHSENKIKGSYSMQWTSGVGTTISGWKDSFEIYEMQKNLDRTESLHLPEAAHDDPARVFESQLEALLTQINEEGESLSCLQGDKALPYKKEELTELLLMLREKAPQLEAIGFIVSHPHLLSSPDVRNYLEIVLFDMAGSSIDQTLQENRGFANSLPDVLQKQLNFYEERIQTDPSYYDHYLFILSITRRFRGVYRAYNQSTEARDKFNTILERFSINPILQNADLRPFQFKAVVEYLLLKIENPSSLEEIIRLYHLLQVLPKEAHDVDPNEMDKLSRYYAVLTHSLENVPPQRLSPLLNTICHDQGMDTKDSPWEGSFPLFRNAYCEINLLKAHVLMRTSGERLVTIPTEILTDSTYALAFKEIDKTSMQVKMVLRGNITAYYIFDKNGECGHVEAENGKYRFYKKFSEKEHSFQAISLSYQEDFYPLRSLASDLLYFAPENPNTGLCLDAEGNIRFKFNLQIVSGQAKVNSIIDCRGPTESIPYKQESIKALSSSCLNALKAFENEKDILLLSNDGNLQKLEFVRYGLSFSYKQGKLYSDDLAYQGYWIDFLASQEYPNALVLRHKNKMAPAKIIFADPSTLESKIVTTTRNKSYLENCLLLLKAWWTGKKPNSAEFQTMHLQQEPKHEGTSVLKCHVFTMHSLTKELECVNEKGKIESNIALLTHALFNKNMSHAVSALKQLKLNHADLTKEKIHTLLHFLKVGEDDDGHAAAIKIRIALKLKSLIRKKLAFATLSEQLDTLIREHCPTYLLEGRKIDQRLLLGQRLFEVMLKILKKKDLTFYNEHLRILTLEKGNVLPKFDPLSGVPSWSGQPEVNLKARVHDAKQAGILGVERIPMHYLEEHLAAYKSTGSPIKTLEKGVPHLFQEEELYLYFSENIYILPHVRLPRISSDATPCEAKAVKKLIEEMKFHEQSVKEKTQHNLEHIQLLKRKISHLKKSYKQQSALKKEKIENLLKGIKDPVEAMKIKGGLQQVASFQELTLAFMQKNLAELQEKKLLPASLDIQELKNDLEAYFSAEVTYLLLKNSSQVITKLLDPSLNIQERSVQSEILYQFLTLKRFYEKVTHPELLVYECFSQQIFRSLGSEQNQLHLLNELLLSTNGIFQASTGSGKTALFSVLRGLMKANGTNLVTFRTLPTLFEQSKALLQKNLGNAFEKKIYTLQYNLKMSPIIHEKTKENTLVKNSLFKKIYHELLMTIQEKGCLLTDYKSLPLLQEKWLKLNREFIAMQKDGIPIADIEKEHWTYLKKILLLLQEREETLMDEFDVPNRSCNRLQIQLGKPVAIAPFLIDSTLKIYEELKNDPRLKLSSDLQGELSNDLRLEVIRDCAKKFAGDDLDLFHYFLGEKEADLSSYSREEQDTFALYKDQFYTFLPLALKKASHLDYQRSIDGTRTIPCHEGEPQEGSRPGHPLEEINFTIQDYIQNGVSLLELLQWIQELQNESIKSVTPEKEFAAIFPSHPFPKGKISEQQLLALQNELNHNWGHVRYFLKLKLQNMSTSGEVISMTPHDTAAMAKSVVGLSATTGCIEELPRALQGNTGAVTGVVGEMVYRLLKRTHTDDIPLKYDPEDPLNVLNQGHFHALIDGAGAFRSQAPKDVSTAFMHSQTHLEQVGYPGGKPYYVGKAECSLSKKGYYFPKASARGANIPLDPESRALLTVDRRKTLEDLLQNDGRMRLNGQKIKLAKSIHNPDMNNIEEILVQSARNEGLLYATGLFRSKMQEIPHLIRQEAYKQLLAQASLDQTLSSFEAWQDLFLQKPSHDYNQAGSYHAQNHAIQKIDATPLEALTAKKTHWVTYANQLGLSTDALSSLTWDEDLLQKMPPLVPGQDTSLLMGLEVEEEVEVEHEVERNLDVKIEIKNEELQFNQCGEVPFYAPWVKNRPKEYSAKALLHKAFDERILFTENFLPLDRKDLFKRLSFDHAQPKINNLHIIMEGPWHPNQKIELIIIGDILDDVHHRPYCYYSGDQNRPVTKTNWSMSYDIRTKEIVAKGIITDPEEKAIISDEAFQSIIAQAKFINGEYENYSQSEWIGLCNWLKGVDDLNELQHFFEKTILRTKPRKAAAFKQSPLFKLFEELKTSH